jgi:hypothetical protein
LDVSDEERREAERIGVLVREKLFEIMDLQGEIDALVRDVHPSPFGSAKWKNCRPESLQRLVLITAMQFLLFEPVDLVQGNEEVHVTAKKLISMVIEQLRLLRATEPQG